MSRANNSTAVVACPKCKRTQPQRQKDSIYWCGNCRAQFDGDPDEGGDYFSDPTKRMEVRERRKSR
jgi:ribosomal protein L37AE/L43A